MQRPRPARSSSSNGVGACSRARACGAAGCNRGDQDAGHLASGADESRASHPRHAERACARTTGVPFPFAFLERDTPESTGRPKRPSTARPMPKPPLPLLPPRRPHLAFGPLSLRPARRLSQAGPRQRAHTEATCEWGGAGGSLPLLVACAAPWSQARSRGRPGSAREALASRSEVGARDATELLADHCRAGGFADRGSGACRPCPT